MVIEYFAKYVYTSGKMIGHKYSPGYKSFASSSNRNLLLSRSHDGFFSWAENLL